MRFFATFLLILIFISIFHNLRDVFSFGWNFTLLALLIVNVINIVQAIQVLRKKTAFLALAFCCNALCLSWIIYVYYDLFEIVSPASIPEISYLLANLTVAPCVWASSRQEKKKRPDLPRVFD